MRLTCLLSTFASFCLSAAHFRDNMRAHPSPEYLKCAFPSEAGEMTKLLQISIFSHSLSSFQGLFSYFENVFQYFKGGFLKFMTFSRTPRMFFYETWEFLLFPGTESSNLAVVLQPAPSGFRALIRNSGHEQGRIYEFAARRLIQLYALCLMCCCPFWPEIFE